MDKINNLTDQFSGIIGNKSGDAIKYTKNNSFKFIKQFPILFKSLVVNTQSILLSLVIIIILCGVGYFMYLLYGKHPRSFGTSNYLQIAGSNDNKPKSLDLLYYESLSKSLAYYVYYNNLPLFSNIFKSNISDVNKQKYLKYINNQIFFHTSNASYKTLKNFKEKYNKPIYNVKWGLESIEGLQIFFFDILTKNFNIPKETQKKNKNTINILNSSKDELIQILIKYKHDFENNLQKVNNDNIYSFISAFNYINNTPQNDFILNTYGKFVKVKVSDNDSYKYLAELLNIPKGELYDILRFDKLSDENTIINNKLKEYKNEYNDISNGELLDTYIFRILNGTSDSSDFDTYIKFVQDFGTTGNNFVDSILTLTGTPNNTVNLTRQQQYNINLVTSNQKFKILIYQDIVVYRKFRTLLNNYNNIISKPNLIKNITKEYNWHLERLTYSKYYNGKDIVRIFNENQITRLNKITSNILDLINYPIYKSEMSYGLFAVLYIYLSNDSVSERLKSLSDYYMSFSEMYLAVESLEDFEALKKKRDDINLFKDFLKPAIQFFCIDQIYKNLIKSVIWEDHYQTVAPLWNNFRNKATSLSTYIDCKNSALKKMTLCKTPESFSNNTIEEFSLGNIFEPILEPIWVIRDVFKSIGQIFEVLIYTITNPMEFLKILIGLILYIWVNLLFIILNIGILPFSKKEKDNYKDYNKKTKSEFKQSYITIGRIIFSFFYRTLWLLPIAIFNSSIYLILLLTRIVLVLVIVILDFITNKKASKAFYGWFMACENSPFAWYENSFFHKGNIVERDLMCKKSCPDGYQVSNDGNLCIKIPDYIPNYCPQAQLMRIYKGLKVSGPLNLKEYSLPRGLTDAQKEKYIEDFKKNKKDYYESCQNLSMLKYDDIAKSICSNMEFTKNSNVSQKDIKNICYNKFCKNGNHESFCTKLNEIEYDTSINTGSGDLIRFITSYCLVISLLTLGIYIIDQKIDLINKTNIAFDNIKTKIIKGIKNK